MESIKDVVEEYQCNGCVGGYDISCFQGGDGIECNAHVAGTTITPIVGSIFAGLPVGFNRRGCDKNLKIKIFTKFSSCDWDYEKYNIPVWKHKDEHGNIIVRGLSPRTNITFLHIFLEDCRGDIDCLEITKEDLLKMD